MLESALEVLALYVGLNALITLTLAGLVGRERGRAKVMLGDGGDAALQRAIRAHGNNIEYVPIALILLAVLYMLAAPLWLLHALGLALTVGRVAHGWGMHQEKQPNAGRAIGTMLTLIVFLAGAVSCLFYALV